jgi:hypothetical protein
MTRQTSREKVQRHRKRQAGEIAPLPRCPRCGRRVLSTKTAPLCSVCWKKTPEGRADGARRKRKNREAPRTRRFDADAIWAIKNATGPRRQLAQEFGCSATLIGQIQNGEVYRDLWDPSLATGRNCFHCIHCVQRRCTMDFPELATEGPVRAAQGCSAYQTEEGLQQSDPLP